MDLHGRITAHVWGKIIPKEASDCADFILEIPAIMETRQALADVVAAANPAELTMRIARNFIKQRYPGADKESDAGILMADMKEEGEALFAALSRARKVMKEEA